MRRVERTESAVKKVNPSACTSEEKSRDYDGNLLEGQSKTKRQKKQQKRITKMEDSIRKSNQYLRNHQYYSAITILKKIIENNQLLDLHEFQGMGNAQSWNGRFKDGAKGLLEFSQKQRKEIMNVFDLLALSFALWIDGDQNKLEGCFQQYEQVLQIEERYETFFGLANLYYNCKIYTKAEQFYKKSVELNNKCAKTYEYLGWIYGYWFKFDTLGIAYINKSLILCPSSIECEYLQAVLQKQSNKRQQLLRQVLKRDSKYYRVYLDLSQLQEDRQESLSYINKCIQADEKYTNSYFSLAKLHIKDGDYSQAFQLMIQRTYESKLQSDYAHYYMAIALQRQEKYEDAILYYQGCLRLNPYNVDANLALGILLWDLDYVDEAINSLSRQLLSNPYDYNSANRLGVYFTQIDDLENAVVYFQRAVSINDQFVDGYINLGARLSNLGRNLEAVQCFDKARMLDPNNSDILYGLAICYKDLENTNTALEYCYRCVENGGDQRKDVYQLLGDIYQESNENEKALQFYLRHTALTEQFHTYDIFAKLIRDLSKEQAFELLKNASERSEDNDDFTNIEISKLATLKQIEKLAVDSLKRLYRKERCSLFHPKVAQQLLKINDNSRLKLGIMSYMSHMDLVAKKKEFEKKFNFVLRL